MSRNIVRIAGLIFAAFAVVILYQTYIQVFQGSQLLNHPRNRRLQLLEEAVTRGRIIDHSGRVLAESTGTGENKKRIYPYKEITANITGYLSKRYGRWGLESSYNEALLGLDSSSAGDDFWALQRLDAGKRGDDIVLSLDTGLQQIAYRMLGDRKGAVVAIEPSTGRVLAMVSRPGFNPEIIDADWDNLKENTASPLLNRATQGLYPPGSTMKVVTAAGILGIKPDAVNRSFDAPGYINIEGRRIEDKQAVGRLSFTEAFARSSNYVFASLGIEQGAAVFTKTLPLWSIIRPLVTASSSSCS
ncbi:MAG: penicillin-binding transpeptidase domain-containing protein, partial [Firmicutes bacterium]|nr:penicillin-binding transpeptidase domain-containing protein [Bacillota bacterium]